MNDHIETSVTGSDNGGRTGGSRRKIAIGTIVGLVGAIAAVVGLAQTSLIEHDNKMDQKAAAASDAREKVQADIQAMGELDAQGGLSNESQIIVLAKDVASLIDRFHLKVDAEQYGLLAEYVSYSTRQLDLAERYAQAVLRATDANSRDIVLAHRVLGDVGAKSGDKEALQKQYEEAMKLSGDRSLGPKFDEFTKAFGVLSAYAGARMNDSNPALQADFCALAGAWRSYLPDVTAHERNDRVAEQLRRLHSKGVHDLEAICA